MFIHKNKIPEDPEDDEHYSRQRMHESVTFPFKDNGIIVVRKSVCKNIQRTTNVD